MIRDIVFMMGFIARWSVHGALIGGHVALTECISDWKEDSMMKRVVFGGIQLVAGVCYVMIAMVVGAMMGMIVGSMLTTPPTQAPRPNLH